MTVSATVNADVGAGEAETVKLAAVPSVTAEPAVMLITGSDGVPPSSSSATLTVAAFVGASDGV